MYIQEICKELQLSKKAINLYEEKGLIQPQKDSKGYRLYNEKERKVLLQVKQLRKLGLTIDEIKGVLLENKYEIFDQKKLEYQKKSFQLDTSIQYIDKVKESLIEGNDFEELSEEMNSIYDLDEQFTENNIEIDFDKIALCFMAFAWACFINADIPIILEMISVICFICAMFICVPRVRVILLNIVKYFQK